MDKIDASYEPPRIPMPRKRRFMLGLNEDAFFVGNANQVGRNQFSGASKQLRPLPFVDDFLVHWKYRTPAPYEPSRYSGFSRAALTKGLLKVHSHGITIIPNWEKQSPKVWILLPI